MCFILIMLNEEDHIRFDVHILSFQQETMYVLFLSHRRIYTCCCWCADIDAAIAHILRRISINYVPAALRFRSVYFAISRSK